MTQCFLRLHALYGHWPKQVHSDHGQEWEVGLTALPHVGWKAQRGGHREEIEGWSGEYLKRRIKDFDTCFPARRPPPDLERVRRWLPT